MQVTKPSMRALYSPVEQAVESIIPPAKGLEHFLVVVASTSPSMQ